MTEQIRRVNSKKALNLIINLATYHNIVISGFLRDKENSALTGVVIKFVPPIKEEDLEK